MRLLFVCPNLQAGGTERHWSILAPRLTARGFDVRILTLDGRGPFYEVLQAAGIRVQTVADAGSRRNAVALTNMVRHPVDVIISCGTTPDALGLAATLARPGRRWAVNWHHPTGMPLMPRRRMIERAVLPRADVVVSVSTSQIDQLGELGVPPRAIRVIANGTDFVPAPEARGQTRAELGVGEAEVACLLVGRLEPQKRIDRFIEAVAQAQKSRPEVLGLVAGAGPDRANLEDLARRVGARVRFLGRRDDMPSVLAASDALCLVSDHEALPFVVLEAMATALPVIATRVGGLPEVVLPGETGLLCDVGDADQLVAAMVQIASEPRLRSEMGTAGRARQLRLYSAEPMADAYASLLRELA